MCSSDLGAGGSYPQFFTALGSYLYFRAYDDTHGWELWRTDGTTTTLVSDIWEGGGGSYPQGFTALGGYLYFSAYDSAHGREVWRIGDGLPATDRNQSTDLPSLLLLSSLLAAAGTLLLRREGRAW